MGSLTDATLVTESTCRAWRAYDFLAGKESLSRVYPPKITWMCSRVGSLSATIELSTADFHRLKVILSTVHSPF